MLTHQTRSPIVAGLFVAVVTGWAGKGLRRGVDAVEPGGTVVTNVLLRLVGVRAVFARSRDFAALTAKVADRTFVLGGGGRTAVAVISAVTLACGIFTLFQ